MHEDKVVLTGDCQHLGPQVRRRLTPISDDFFQPLHPRLVRMHGRMITVVISEILTGNIDVASHNFLESVFKEPPDKRLVFFHGHWTSSLAGQRWRDLGFLANVYRLHPDVQVKSPSQWMRNAARRRGSNNESHPFRTH